MRDILTAVEAAVGVAVPFLPVARRAGDPAELVAAVERARTILGWTPQHSSIAEIARTAAAWHRKEKTG